MSEGNTTTTPDTATLTESELFGLLLDAPARSEARSSLIVQRIEPRSLQDELIGFFESESLFDVVSHDMIINAIRASDEPGEELRCVIFDLECLVDGLRALQREFRSLAEQTRICPTATGSQDSAQPQQIMRYSCPGPMLEVSEAD